MEDKDGGRDWVRRGFYIAIGFLLGSIAFVFLGLVVLFVVLPGLTEGR